MKTIKYLQRVLYSCTYDNIDTTFRTMGKISADKILKYFSYKDLTFLAMLKPVFWEK